MVDPVTQTEKEITIKLNKTHLKKGGYILILLLLVGIIIAQQYGVISTSGSGNSSATGNIIDQATAETEDKGILEEATDAIVEEVTEQVDAITEIITGEEEESAVVGTIENETEEEEEELLDITGDVLVTIDKIDVDPKPNIEDYAKVKSVKFTIKNKDKDFTPTVKAHLLSDTDDIKDITLAELEAGNSITETSTKLFFGYNDIDETKSLKLQVFNGKKKLLVSTTKTFTTE